LCDADWFVSGARVVIVFCFFVGLIKMPAQQAGMIVYPVLAILSALIIPLVLHQQYRYRYIRPVLLRRLVENMQRQEDSAKGTM
jgi:hypothetical protein